MRLKGRVGSGLNALLSKHHRRTEHIMKYLIVGTGRCGTVYMARLLTSVGIMCGHESLFNYNGPQPLDAPTSYASTHVIVENHKPEEEWFDASQRQAESSWLAAPYLQHSMLDCTTVIHLVREPGKVISSLICNDHKFFDFLANDYVTPYRQFILKHLPEIQELNTEVDRAAYLYVQWNKMIERLRPDAVLERIEDQPEKMLEMLGINKTQHTYANKTANRWKVREEEISLSNITEKCLLNEIITMSRRYNYQGEKCLKQKESQIAVLESRLEALELRKNRRI